MHGVSLLKDHKIKRPLKGHLKELRKNDPFQNVFFNFLSSIVNAKIFSLATLKFR